jgi:DNA polymerase delta subunit 2
MALMSNLPITQIAGEQARRVERVLDVRQGELCWVTGTVYMDMPLKPNILDDVAKDVSSTISVIPFFFFSGLSLHMPC